MNRIEKWLIFKFKISIWANWVYIHVKIVIGIRFFVNVPHTWHFSKKTNYLIPFNCQSLCLYVKGLVDLFYSLDIHYDIYKSMTSLNGQDNPLAASRKNLDNNLMQDFNLSKKSDFDIHENIFCFDLYIYTWRPAADSRLTSGGLNVAKYCYGYPIKS